MKLTTKGRVTIPRAIRKRLGLLPGNDVHVDVVDDSVRIHKKTAGAPHGTLVVEALRRAPKPRPGITTDQLMALTRGD